MLGGFRSNYADRIIFAPGHWNAKMGIEPGSAESNGCRVSVLRGEYIPLDEAPVQIVPENLADDTRVIRNRRKLQAITDNARRMIEIDEEFGTFQKYLRSHDSFWDLVRDFRKQFKFLGDMGAYYWLYVVGEEVPPHDQFEAERPQKKR